LVHIYLSRIKIQAIKRFNSGLRTTGPSAANASTNY
jgi:hypothetical protein